MSLKRKNFAPLFLGWIDAEYKNLRFGDEFSYSEESAFHRWRIRFEDISAKTRSSRPLIGKVGDVIGCGIDFERKTIVFSLNGSFPHRFGIRHRNIQFKEWITPSFVIHGCVVAINFGDSPFHYPMSGYPSVSDRIKEHNALLHSLPSPTFLDYSDSTSTLVDNGSDHESAVTLSSDPVSATMEVRREREEFVNFF
jgi:hypothetical protein